MSNGGFYLPYLRGCSIKGTYVPVQFNRQQNMLFCLYFLSFSRVQLKFNSHLTGNPRSTEIAGDNSPSD